MIVAPVEVPPGCAAGHHAVEVRAPSVRSGLESDREICRAPGAVQYRGLQIREVGVERQRRGIDRRDRRVIREELERLVVQLGEERRTRARCQPALRSRFRHAVLEATGRESQDGEHPHPGPPGEIAVQQDLLAGGVGNLRYEEHLPHTAQDPRVRVVAAGRAQCHPERERRGDPVLLVGDALVPRAVAERLDRELHLCQVVLRQREPFAIEGEPGNPMSGGGGEGGDDRVGRRYRPAAGPECEGERRRDEERPAHQRVNRCQTLRATRSSAARSPAGSVS